MAQRRTKKEPPDTAQPSTPKRTPAQVKKWVEMNREIDDRLKELLYEDRNGFKPPKPWYEE
jgi:hypothetical protein